MFGTRSVARLILVGRELPPNIGGQKHFTMLLCRLSPHWDLITNFFCGYGWECTSPKQEHEMIYEKTWIGNFCLCPPDRQCFVIWLHVGDPKRRPWRNLARGTPSGFSVSWATWQLDLEIDEIQTPSFDGPVHISPVKNEAPGAHRQ